MLALLMFTQSILQVTRHEVCHSAETNKCVSGDQKDKQAIWPLLDLLTSFPNDDLSFHFVVNLYIMILCTELLPTNNCDRLLSLSS